MKYFIILLVGSFIVFAPAKSWSGAQHEDGKQQFKAHDPVKDPLAYQDKDGFPTGPGCSVPEGFFQRIDKIKNLNPCAPVVYNPCSAKADPVNIPRVGEN